MRISEQKIIQLIEEEIKIIFHAEQYCDFVEDLDVISKFTRNDKNITYKDCIESLYNIEDYLGSLDVIEDYQPHLSNLKRHIKKLQERKSSKEDSK